MKKLFAILLTVAMLASMATAVSAASTTTLTTTVPAATYILNVPIDQTIPYGKTAVDLGSITISDSNGFAEGKNLLVTITYDAFKCENVTTTIPFTVQMTGTNIGDDAIKEISSGNGITFMGKKNGTVNEYIISKNYDYSGQPYDITRIVTASEDWGKALAGEYTATITFTAEVVAG